MADTGQQIAQQGGFTTLESWHGPTSVNDIGMSVVFEPSGTPDVDIVLVHGLQGHPFRTWAAPRAATANPATPKSSTKRRVSGDSLPFDDRRKKVRLGKKMLGVFRPKPDTSLEDSTSKTEECDDRAEDSLMVDAGAEVDARHPTGSLAECPLYFWPREALPGFCPGARVLTWGYDSHVTKGLHGPSNQSSVYQHGKDFLYGMSRLGSTMRPKVLIAHSLGGIVTKEMLSLSHNSSDDRLNAIARSTAAVVFLGTPHRGSPWAKVGNAASKIVKSLGMDTSSALLDALGLKTSDLQRSQESFSAVWNNNPIRVKTFQEGQGLKGTSFGGLSDKVVDEISSSLGDEREHAEVLNANHRDMCRFSGPRDPNLITIMAELADICNFSLELGPVKALVPGPYQTAVGEAQSASTDLSQVATVADIHIKESQLLQSLSFPGMHEACQPWDTTKDCEWLIKHTAFQNWCFSEDGPNTHPILWIKGDPGSGKSTAIKEAVQMLSSETQFGYSHLASFFFSSQADDELLHSVTGLYRSLLSQLLPKSRRAMAKAVDRHQSKLEVAQSVPVTWTQRELAQMFGELFADASSPISVLIDALDECDDHESTLQLVNSFHDLIFRDQVGLHICLTTRHVGTIPLQGCVYIDAELANGPGIQSYIDKSFSRYKRQNESEFAALKGDITERSRGNFLWVVLVTERLIKEIVKGKRNCFYLTTLLSETPRTLMELYGDLIKNAGDQEMMLQVLRWAVLAKELTLREWRYLLPFLQHRPPRSFLSCQWSEFWARDDEDLADLICNTSMGLVRITQKPAPASLSVDTIVTGDNFQHDKVSLGGRAGSLDSEQGETRLVSLIHRSVAEVFKQEDKTGFCGMEWMGGIRDGHLAILDTCISIIAVRDLNNLVDARLKNG